MEQVRAIFSRDLEGTVERYAHLSGHSHVIIILVYLFRLSEVFSCARLHLHNFGVAEGLISDLLEVHLNIEIFNDGVVQVESVDPHCKHEFAAAIKGQVCGRRIL